MSDGDIDYSKFTLLELEEALAGINRQRYPQNYANLRSAYEQRTAAIGTATPPRVDVVAREDKDPDTDWWGKFWGSRPVMALAAAGFLWWTYDLLSDTDSCPSGGRLLGDLVKATCDNFGHVAAAGIPLTFAVVFAVLAIRTRRQDGA